MNKYFEKYFAELPLRMSESRADTESRLAARGLCASVAVVLLGAVVLVCATLTTLSTLGVVAVGLLLMATVGAGIPGLAFFFMREYEINDATQRW